MRRRWFGAGLGLCALAVFALGGSALADDAGSNSTARAFDAVLTGANEVPATTSTGLGLSALLLSSDGNTLHYTLEVTGASSTVNAAHIHLAGPGQNGDVVVNLCGAGGAPACGQEGVIASGSITASSLVGPLAGHTLADLVSSLRSGAAYVNIHTANFPSGELRGQVESRGGMTHESDNGGRDNGPHGDGEHGDEGESD